MLAQGSVILYLFVTHVKVFCINIQHTCRYLFGAQSPCTKDLRKLLTPAASGLVEEKKNEEDYNAIKYICES